MAEQHALTWGEEASGDDKLWGMIAHVSVYVSWFLGPLIVMLIYQEKSPYIKYHAIQALIGQIALTVVAAIGGTVIMVISWFTCGVGALLYLPLSLIGFVPLYGAYKAYSGNWDGYPMISQFGR
jgi:uncharacterized Tic20 family protein